MAEDRERDRGFTVTDRRRFRTDSEPSESEEAEGGSEEARDDPAPSQASDPGEASPQADARGEATDRGRVHHEITLATFVMSLSTQALMLMGEIPNPTTQRMERDMAAAREVIDILGMLRTKTAGNLDENEEGLFENVLYDLRMRYVELQKGGDR